MENGNTQSTRRWMDFAHAGPDSVGGMLLRRYWQPVYVSAQLAAGRAVPITIMGEKFTLYRGDTGTAHIVGFRCAHRNTQLSTGWVRGDAIQCFYHGWTYDPTGACIARPGESPPGRCAEAQIPAYPTREHMGLIYGYFGAAEPPAFPPFPQFDGEGIIENSVDDFPCNWFQTYENQADETHLAFVHSPGGSHRALGREVQLPRTWPEDAEHGMVRYSRVGDGPVRSTLYLFPNTMRIIIPPPNDLVMGGWRDSYLTLVPTDDCNHLLFMTYQVRATGAEAQAYLAAREQYRERLATARPARDIALEILAGKLTIADVLDHPRLFVVEDAVAQAGQGQMADRSIEYLGQTDMCIVRMRRLFDRELRALAEGREVKEWRYSGQTPARGW